MEKIITPKTTYITHLLLVTILRKLLYNSDDILLKMTNLDLVGYSYLKGVTRRNLLQLDLKDQAV